MVQTKPRPRMTSKVRKASKATLKDQVKPTRLIPESRDNARSLALAGLAGLILAYIVGARALNTGSYWEYLITFVLLIIVTRLFIRSIRLK